MQELRANINAVSPPRNPPIDGWRRIVRLPIDVFNDSTMVERSLKRLRNFDDASALVESGNYSLGTSLRTRPS